jgi:hypothetical protein
MFQVITVDVGDIYILFHALVKRAIFGKFYVWVARKEIIFGQHGSTETNFLK